MTMLRNTLARCTKKLLQSLPLRQFCRNQRGNVVTIFGLSLLPMAVAAGVAVDYSRISGARSSLQAAVDAGVIAAATESNGRSAPELEATVTQFVQNNKGTHPYKNLQMTVSAANDWTVTANGSACIDLIFAGVLGQSTACFNVEAEAQRGKNHLEVVLVLDNTGSMDTASDRIGNLRNAAKLLVDILEKAANGNRTVKISLVPFVTAVNVKGEGFDTAWIDNNGQNPQHGANFDALPGGGRVNHFTLFNKLGLNWKGCVEARPTPYALNDTPPSIANPSTLFVPYFSPDDPGIAAAGGNNGGSYNNSYLNDATSGSLSDTAKQRSLAKYDVTLPIVPAIVETATKLGGGQNLTTGPNRACPTPILPLTNDFNKLRTNIAAMRHWNGSGTNVSEGLMWGWRVLSPEPPYTAGKPFLDPTVQKVVVLLTDGENVVYGASGTEHKSDYGSYGYLASGRFNALDQNAAARNVDGWVQSTCTNLKANRVMIYTITLEAGTAANKALYGPCASRPEMYFDSPSATQLSGIFTTIAQQLVALKLTR
ncbi:MAG: pilus assembly protein TadG-related protein [Beijerinckiaceae bacterium]